MFSSTTTSVFSFVLLLACLTASCRAASSSTLAPLAFIAKPMQSRRTRVASQSITALWMQPTNVTHTLPHSQESSSTSLHYARTGASALSSRPTSPQRRDVRVYCDMDGVLCDFEQGVVNLLQKRPHELVKGTMWKTIARANAFYEKLDWTRDGRRLWESIAHLDPDILTGVPYHPSSRVEKFNWCTRELGVDTNFVDMASGCRDHENVNGSQRKEGVVNVITCWSNNKFHEACEGAVLIDDSEWLGSKWEDAGGIFIHHRDTDSTVRKLQELGII